MRFCFLWCLSELRSLFPFSSLSLSHVRLSFRLYSFPSQLPHVYSFHIPGKMLDSAQKNLRSDPVLVGVSMESPTNYSLLANEEFLSGFDLLATPVPPGKKTEEEPKEKQVKNRELDFFCRCFFMINLHHEFALVAVSDAFATTVTDLDGVFLSIFFSRRLGTMKLYFFFPPSKPAQAFRPCLLYLRTMKVSPCLYCSPSGQRRITEGGSTL